jgi:hypothetical protein
LLPAAAGAGAAAAATSAMINQHWWQRMQLRPQQQPMPVTASGVTVHQGVTGSAAGGFMVRFHRISSSACQVEHRV